MTGPERAEPRGGGAVSGDLRREFLQEYLAAAWSSLALGGEATLARSYQLGRRALAAGLGVLDLAAIHQQALEAVLAAPARAGDRERTLKALGEVFSECMSSFEMVHREFKESLEAVRRQAAELEQANEKLRSEVARRARVEAELRSLSMVFENALEGISLVDRRGRFVYANRAFSAMLAAPNGELGERDWLSVFAPADRPAVSLARRKLESREKVELEARLLRPDAIAFPCQLVMIRSPRPQGGDSHYCFVKDITERVRSEVERSWRLAESARAEALSAGNAELQEFSRVVAHELQEPMRTIMSYTKLVVERGKGKMDPQTRRSVALMGEGAGRMSRLIRNLLAYARVESQGAPPQAASAATALAGALADLRAALSESGARVTSDALPTVSADPAQLIQLFENLIANAIKFRGSKPPRIHVSARRADTAWVFSVRDNGSGFEQAQAAQLFMIFRRLQPRIPGHGLGLALCKKIVQRHGGTIWALGEPGKGATFSFTLPPAARRSAAVRDPSAAPALGGNSR